jgi:hypothetical protein
LVTGGISGIGRAVVEEFLTHGAQLPDPTGIGAPFSAAMYRPSGI